MTGQPATLMDRDLEGALLDLAGALAPIPADRLAEDVRRRVEALPPPRRRVPGPLDWFRRRPDPLAGAPRPLRRGLALALVALLVIAGVAAAIGFGLPGLRIVILGPGPAGTPTTTAAVPSTPGLPSTPPTSPPPTIAPTAAPLDSLGLGRRVGPADLDAAAGRHVLLPSLPELGSPLALFVRGTSPDTLVTAAYGPAAAIPAGSLAPVDAGEPVAVLVTELPGATDGAYLEKMLPPGATIDRVRVGGHDGFWIAGQPHELLYVAPNGDVVSEPARLAGNVLAWNDGELTFRIEGAPDLATAQRIAASLR